MPWLMVVFQIVTAGALPAFNPNVIGVHSSYQTREECESKISAVEQEMMMKIGRHEIACLEDLFYQKKDYK
jgi:hypothetical protein